MAAVSSSASYKVSLKLLVDTHSQKVLFAEANKEFLDFLFHILSLPIGTVIRLLRKITMVGSLGNLYNSIENFKRCLYAAKSNQTFCFEPQNFQPWGSYPLLLPNDDASMARKLYVCKKHGQVTHDPALKCPECDVYIAVEAKYATRDGAVKETPEGGGFVKGVVAYMVTDDLTVTPMSAISSITMLNKFNVKEVGVLQEKVSLEMEEGLMLLKASLQCKDVLTSVFLAK